MEVMCNNVIPGDTRLVEQLVSELKSQGIFDQFRKECISDVDTKPAYQNLRQRVEGTVATFLKQQTWNVDLNKNQLREQVRKNLQESGVLETGVERIVDQVVNPKINTVFLPKVEDVVYGFLGIQKPFRNVKKEEPKATITDLLPTDLEAISPESVGSFKQEKKDGSLNGSLPSSGKLEEDESPPFEPLGIQSNPENSADAGENKMQIDEHSRDSHLSGFSGLQSHESPQDADTKMYQMDLSTQDSQNSSETHLSIVTSEDTTKMEICEDSNNEIKVDVKSDELPKIEDNNSVKEVIKDVTKSEEPITELVETRDENEKKKQDKYADKKSRTSEKSSSKDKKDDKHKKSGSSSSKEKDKLSSSSSSKHSSHKDHVSSKEKSQSKKDSKSSSSRDKEKSKDRFDKEKDKSSKYKDKSDKDKPKHDKDDKVDKSKSEKDSTHKVDKEKSDKNKDKTHSEKERSKSDKDKSTKVRDKSKSDRDKDRDKDKDKKEKHRDHTSKNKDKTITDKDSKDKSVKEKDKEFREKRKEGKENDKEASKDKHKNSNSASNKHSSGKDKKRDSSSSHLTKEKSSSSSSLKENIKHGDSKSRSSSEKSKKDDDRHSTNTSSNKKDKHGDSKKKSKDDHYSSKIKKNDRRSTDRDSNDGTSNKQNYLGSYSESTSSKSENNSQDYSNSSFSGGSGDSGNSDRSENVINKVSEGDNHQAEKETNTSWVATNLQIVKYIKPKFALNFQEARKIMKIRKQLAKMERQNQLSLSHIDLPIQNGMIKEENHSSVESDEVDLSEEKENINISKTKDDDRNAVKEIVTSKTLDNIYVTNQDAAISSSNEEPKEDSNVTIENPIETIFETKDLSNEKFEALEAKLAQVMAAANSSSYESDEEYEFHGYSPAEMFPKDSHQLNLNIVQKTILNNQLVAEHNLSKNREKMNNIAVNHLDEDILKEHNNYKSRIRNNFRRLSVKIRKRPELIKNDEKCCFLEKPSAMENKNLRYIKEVIEQLEREVQKICEVPRNNGWSMKKRARKRKLDESFNEKHNNNTEYSVTVKKRRDSSSSNTSISKANKKRMSNNTEISPNEHFSLPLSPAESDKSNDRKEEDLLIPMKQKRIIRGYTQRYSSDDLYKPRPVIGRRNKCSKNTR